MAPRLLDLVARALRVRAIHEEWVENMTFRDRCDAGTRLGKELARYRQESPVVIALPRGGVEVAYPIAVTLGAALEVWCVRKIGAPGNAELALGAIAEGGVVYVDNDLAAELGLDDDALQTRIAAATRELEARVSHFRKERAAPAITGRTVIVVDDGIATGSTVEAALLAIRTRKPKRIVLAVPVAVPSSLRRLYPLTDDVVVLETPEDLCFVGARYEDFRQLSDERVDGLLENRRETLEVHRQR